MIPPQSNLQWAIGYFGDPNAKIGDKYERDVVTPDGKKFRFTCERVRRNAPRTPRKKP